MKRHLLLATVTFSLLSPVALAQDANNQTMDMSNLSAQQFVTLAASTDMFEIQSSQLAQQNAQRDNVKEFAEEIIEDHTAASQQLQQIAAEENLSVPTEMAEMHEDMLESLSGTSAADFDAAYAAAQVQAHEMALAMMTAYAENGDNDDLQAYAQKAAPVIQQHLESAQELRGS